MIAYKNSGIANNLWIVIAGRAISGIGGAGIMTIGSVIITGKSSSPTEQPREI